MKIYKFILIAIMFLCFKLNAQWKWEKTDSRIVSKSDLYSDTKKVIRESFKSPKNIIRVDDKLNGIIVVRGVSEKLIWFRGDRYIYYYQYDVTFTIKENSRKVTIDNVYCYDAIHLRYPTIGVTKINPFDGRRNCPKTGSITYPGISRWKADKMMGRLKDDISYTFYNLFDYIQNEPILIN